MPMTGTIRSLPEMKFGSPSPLPHHSPIHWLFQIHHSPDPTTFAFFNAIDDAGNGKGLLQATVTNGSPVGVYRVCTMIAARNHQFVNMPVAQRCTG
jgi:hypothetical protein